jgi:hypothetical protein
MRPMMSTTRATSDATFPPAVGWGVSRYIVRPSAVVVAGVAAFVEAIAGASAPACSEVCMR